MNTIPSTTPQQTTATPEIPEIIPSKEPVPQRLSIVTTTDNDDDAFPNFEDPNLFSGSPSAPPVLPYTGAVGGASNFDGVHEGRNTQNDADSSQLSIARTSVSLSSAISIDTTENQEFQNKRENSIAITIATQSSSQSAQNSGAGKAGVLGIGAPAGRLLLPVPVSASLSNMSQSSFALSEVSTDADGTLDGLSPEIAKADISISGASFLKYRIDFLSILFGV